MDSQRANKAVIDPYRQITLSLALGLSRIVYTQTLLFCELVGVLVCPPFEDRYDQNFDIQPKAPGFDVYPIVLYTRNHVADSSCFSTKSVDLSPTSNAWLNAVS